MSAAGSWPSRRTRPAERCDRVGGASARSPSPTSRSRGGPTSARTPWLTTRSAPRYQTPGPVWRRPKSPSDSADRPTTSSVPSACWPAATLVRRNRTPQCLPGGPRARAVPGRDVQRLADGAREDVDRVGGQQAAQPSAGSIADGAGGKGCHWPITDRSPHLSRACATQCPCRRPAGATDGWTRGSDPQSPVPRAIRRGSGNSRRVARVERRVVGPARVIARAELMLLHGHPRGIQRDDHDLLPERCAQHRFRPRQDRLGPARLHVRPQCVAQDVLLPDVQQRLPVRGTSACEHLQATVTVGVIDASGVSAWTRL